LIASKRVASSINPQMQIQSREKTREREREIAGDREKEIEKQLELLNESAKVVFRAATK